MKRREVISKCMEMSVPIFNGRIDRTLFLSSFAATRARAQAAAGRRLARGCAAGSFPTERRWPPGDARRPRGGE